MVKKDETMRNLTNAVFLTFIFCAVFANGKDLGRGSNQNPSFTSATSSRRISENNRPLNSNRSFRDTLWEEKLKEWEKRHSPVPKSLPRVDFKSHRPSSSRSYRAPHRSFRSSHRRVTHHSSRGGKIHIKIKSKRR